MGLALSEYLASQGAHVTIVARDVKKLEEAKLRIEASKFSDMRWRSTNNDC